VTAVAARWRQHPAWLTPLRRRALFHGLVVAGWVFAAWHFLYIAQYNLLGSDAYAYWAVDLANLYAGHYSAYGFFPYPPPAAD
jgi:hypothetical protein